MWSLLRGLCTRDMYEARRFFSKKIWWNYGTFESAGLVSKRSEAGKMIESYLITKIVSKVQTLAERLQLDSYPFGIVQTLKNIFVHGGLVM